MDLPAIIDLKAIAAIGVLALNFTQYIKDAIPEKYIRGCNLIAGIGFSYLWFYTPEAPPTDFIVLIANGVIGAMLGDTTYQFLSGSGSPPFSLPRKQE